MNVITTGNLFQKQKQKTHLMARWRFHTGKNPFGCNQGGEIFSCNSSRKKHHHGFHTEQKPSECFECLKFSLHNAHQS